MLFRILTDIRYPFFLRISVRIFVFWFYYSVTQSFANSLLGYVVLDSFDKVYRDEDSILDQTYQKQAFSDFNYKDLEF